MRTGRELLADSAATGSEEAFSGLAFLYGRLVYRTCLRLLGNEHDAAEASQAVFMVLMRKRRSLRFHREPAAWLYRVARNVARVALRARFRRARHEEEAVMVRAVEKESAGAGSEADAVRGEVLSLLDRAMEALPAAQREAVLLRYFQGLSQRQAAEAAGCPQGTLARRAQLGLDRLRRVLGRRGATVSSAALVGILAAEATVPVPAALLSSLLSMPAMSAAGAGGAAVGVLARGAVQAMFWSKLKTLSLVVLAAATVGAGAGAPLAYSLGFAGRGRTPGGGAPVPTGLNPFNGRLERVDVFEFAVKPRIRKQGPSCVISFESRAACDATVAVIGPDGRIVRHLASGVLGRNAPWPLKQGALSQSIAWDGNDDFGRPVPTGCAVRVGLGLKAEYDRSLGWSPGKTSQRMGFAVGPGGRLYVLDGGVRQGQGVCFGVRVYDREGRYLRQVSPPPAHVAPEVATIEWNRTSQGGLVPRTRVGYYGVTLTREEGLGEACTWQTPVVTRDGKFVMISRSSREQRARKLVVLDGRDGRIGKGDVILIDKDSELMGVGRVHNGGPVCMALSPDGRWLYLGSPEGLEGVHGVFRVDIAGRGRARLFLGERNRAGRDNAHFSSPRGVACDSKGNVYVADRGNDRIQVFTAGGRFLKTIPVTSPNQIAVHRKTGEIYVMQLLRKDGLPRRQMTLLKLGGLDDPAVRFRRPAIQCDHNEELALRSPLLAVDDSGDETYLWLKLSGNHIARFRDAGTRLQTVSAGEVNKVTRGWNKWNPLADRCQITADPVHEELYIREDGMCGAGAMIRVDGRSGKVLDSCGQQDTGMVTPFGVENVRVSWGGRVYYRTGHRGEWLTCYDPETKQLVPLPGATWTAQQQGSVEYKGRPYRAVYIPASGGARTFQDVMGVGLNGDLYIPCGIRRQDVPLLKAAGMEFPVDEKMLNPDRGSLLKVFSAEGELKCLSALPGLGPSSGICAGRAGELYAALACQPGGAGLPEGMAPGAKVDPLSWGSVVKFDSRTGGYPLGRIRGRWTPSLGGAATHRWMVGRGGQQFS